MSTILLSAFALSGGSAVARTLAEVDALAQPPGARNTVGASDAQAAPASYHVSFHEVLNIPTFLSASDSSKRLSGASLMVSNDPSQVARGYLKSLADLYRIAPREVDALPVNNTQRLPSGAAIVQFGHTINGIEVFRERASVLVGVDGALNSIGGYVSGADSIDSVSTDQLFRVDNRAAVSVALRDYEFASSAVPSALNIVDSHDSYDYFDFAAGSGSAELLSQPVRVKPVFFRSAHGLIPAYYMEVSVASAAGDDDSLYSYVVSAKDGSLLFRHSLQANDVFAYRVWAEPNGIHFPLPGPNGRGATPHPTGIPDGLQPPFVAPILVSVNNVMAPTSVAANDPWLPSGALVTSGNNVDAFADLSAPDLFSPGDLRATITSANTFDRTFDTSLTPQANSNQISAAITQLFYMNNWLHDWYYDDGFDEVSGNAQGDNYGRGGIAGDWINAEAQDYAARNNANMSTPADGGHPRMRMYVFDGTSTLAITASGNLTGVYTPGRSDTFGPQTFDVTGDVVYVVDALAPTGDGCDLPFSTNLTGKIALIDRGTCGFVVKAKNAQTAGAIGLIVANNVAGVPPGMTGTDASVTIPATILSQSDAGLFKAALTSTVTARLQRGKALDRDGTIDDAVIAHEWGHYISNRLVHNASGLTTNMSGGMGEGFGDFHALLMMVEAADASLVANPFFSGVYVEGGYVEGGTALANIPNNGYYYGFRRYPYSSNLNKNPLTFKYVADGAGLPASPVANDNGGLNSEVHNTGEVWASALWQCYSNLLRDTPRLSFDQAQDRMKRYMVGGYKMMPAAPTFTEARDAILAVAAANDLADYADCASGFATRGMGVGAQSPPRASTNNVGVVESFTYDAAVASFVAVGAVDASNSCDMDNQLDSLESGFVKISIHNAGFKPMNATTLTVSSPDAFVSFPSTTVAVPSIAPTQTVVASVPVTLGSVSGIQTITVNYSATDPELSAPITGSAQIRVNVDNIASSTDDFENTTLAWTTASTVAADPIPYSWTLAEIDSTHHWISGPDGDAAGVTSITSPPMHVSSSGTFSVSFAQQFDFESSDHQYDGGVIEISDDAGANWHDVTAFGGALTPAYNGSVYTYSGGANPLAGRAAYVANAALGTATIDFGTSQQGKTVQIRFVIGSDDAGGANGWQIDNFAASGIDNLPFTSIVADPGHCVLLDTIYQDGFDGL